MPASVTIRDETPAGGVWNEWSLDLSRESVTVRDLIRERVYQEVQDHNIRRQGARAYRGLVQPEGYEEAPNGPRSALRPRRSTGESSIKKPSTLSSRARY